MTRRSQAKKAAEEAEISLPKEKAEKDPLRVFLLPDSLMKKENDMSYSIISLKHPKSDSKALFLLDKDANVLYELVAFAEKYRSWFIGNYVEQGGSLYVITLLDPLFLILPYLLKQKSKFSPLEDLLVDNNFPESKNLQQCSEKYLHHVTDSKDCGGMTVYRLNTFKMFDWLKQKVEKVTKTLEEREVCVGASSKSSALIRSKKDSKPSKDDFMSYGYSIVADYLPTEVAEELKEQLGLKEKENTGKKVQTASDEPPSKKKKSDEKIEPEEDYCTKEVKSLLTQESKGAKLTVAQKKLQKSDTSGMKSISSFFTKK